MSLEEGHTIHDYLTWATKLTRMMPRGLELIPQF